MRSCGPQAPSRRSARRSSRSRWAPPPRCGRPPSWLALLVLAGGAAQLAVAVLALRGRRLRAGAVALALGTPTLAWLAGLVAGGAASAVPLVPMLAAARSRSGRASRCAARRGARATKRSTPEPSRARSRRSACSPPHPPSSRPSRRGRSPAPRPAPSPSRTARTAREPQSSRGSTSRSTPGTDARGLPAEREPRGGRPCTAARAAPEPAQATTTSAATVRSIVTWPSTRVPR